MTPNAPDGRSHEERRAAARETYKRFVPDVKPEQVAESFTARLGPLGTFAYEIVGDMWNRPELNRRDRSLMIITTLAAQSRDEELVVHTQIGLRHGLLRIEIEEILPHIAAYAGFPAAMAASRQIDEGLRRAEGVETLTKRAGTEPKSDAQRDADAADVLAVLNGQTSRKPSEHLSDLTTQYGYLGETSYRWVLGEIWARSELSLRDRSLVTLTIVICLGGDSMLKKTLRESFSAGLTEQEVEEMIAHLGLYAGLVRATAAMDCFRTL